MIQMICNTTIASRTDTKTIYKRDFQISKICKTQVLERRMAGIIRETSRSTIKTKTTKFKTSGVKIIFDHSNNITQILITGKIIIEIYF